MCSESIKPAHAPTLAHGAKSGQKEIDSTSAISRIELETSRFWFNRTAKLSQSVPPTWKYALWVGIYTIEPDPHLLCCAWEQCFTNISTADDYFRAPFRDSWSELNHWMRSLVENTPLLESEPSDLNQTLLTKQSSVKILSLDKNFCMKITLS